MGADLRRDALMRRWTSLAALMLILLFAGAADGLMDALGPLLFCVVGAAVMGATWALTEYKEVQE